MFGAVHNCQKTGKCGSKKIKDMADKIKADDVTDFASTKHKGLPNKVKKKKKRFESFKEWQEAADTLAEDFGSRMDKTKMRSTVSRREDMLKQAVANDQNVYRRLKPIWDMLVNSQVPVPLVYRMARAYASQAR